MKKGLSVLDKIGQIDVLVSCISLFGIVTASIWGVIARYIISRPAAWIEEFCLGLFVWLTFFGLSMLARRGEIVSIEFLLHLMPSKLNFFFKKVFTTALMVASCLIIIIFGFKLSLFSFDRYTAILRIPFSFIYMGIPIGSVFTLYHILRTAFSGPRFLENITEEEGGF